MCEENKPREANFVNQVSRDILNIKQLRQLEDQQEQRFDVDRGAY